MTNEVVYLNYHFNQKCICFKSVYDDWNERLTISPSLIVSCLALPCLSFANKAFKGIHLATFFLLSSLHSLLLFLETKIPFMLFKVIKRTGSLVQKMGTGVISIQHRQIELLLSAISDVLVNQIKVYNVKVTSVGKETEDEDFAYCGVCSRVLTIDNGFLKFKFLKKIQNRFLCLIMKNFEFINLKLPKVITVQTPRIWI